MPNSRSPTPESVNETEYLQELHSLWRQQWPTQTPCEPIYPLGEKPITEYLSHWAHVHPEKPAVHFYGYSLSYRELEMQSNQFAHYLLTKGVVAGDPVAVFLPNCPQFVIAFMGILKVGAIYHPVSPLSKTMELEHQLSDCCPKLLLCFDQLLPLAKDVCESLQIEHIVTTSLSELRPAEPCMDIPDLLQMPKLEIIAGVEDFYPSIALCLDELPDHNIDLDDIAAINYTGGTTGLPKGCIHTHRHMVYTCASFNPAVTGVADADHISLSFLPQFWIAGENASLLFPFFTGSTQVLMSRWDCSAFMAAVQHYRVEFCTLLVDSVDEVLNHPELKQFDLSSLQRTPCVSFIKKLNLDYRQRWKKITACTLFESSFGMTETNTCDTFTAGFQENDFDLSFDPSFVGLPVAGTEFKVCDFETSEILPLGQEGELCLRSPALFSGYWNKPELNPQIFDRGWFKTGDLGVINKEGFIRYLGRRKEMIKVNGMSVFPSELETLLGRHGGILASAVIARKDSNCGQKPVAFIVVREDVELSAEDIQHWCKEAMAVYKIPEIRLVESLPMTATGKVKKNELEQWI